MLTSFVLACVCYTSMIEIKRNVLFFHLYAAFSKCIVELFFTYLAIISQSKMEARTAVLSNPIIVASLFVWPSNLHKCQIKFL